MLLRRTCLALRTILPILALASSAASDENPQDAGPAMEALQRALANRYDLDLAQRIELSVRNDQGGERSYVVEMASKRIDGQLRSFARFTHPPDDYGTAILIIEQRGRSDDTFVYFPYARRVRRVSSAQRADRFMGTDLTYEDFERRYATDYTVLSGFGSVLDGEQVLLVRVVLAPCFEELLFRERIQQQAEILWGGLPAVILSSVSFALYHIDVSTMALPLVGGLVAGAVMLRTRSPALVIGLHGGHNLVVAT